MSKARKFSAKQIRYLWAIGYLKSSPFYKGPKAADLALKTGKRQTDSLIQKLPSDSQSTAQKPEVQKVKDYDPKDLDSLSKSLQSRLTAHPYINSDRVRDHFKHSEVDEGQDYHRGLLQEVSNLVTHDLEQGGSKLVKYSPMSFMSGGKNERFVQPGETAREASDRFNKKARDKWEQETNFDFHLKQKLNEVMSSIDSSQQKLQKVLDSHSVLSRVTPNGLFSILEDGRFKTQVENDVYSSGEHAPDLRKHIDHHLFGFDKEGDPKKRPIYGYIGRDDGSDSKTTEPYGDVVISFKDSVRKRTTVTNGDSLDQNAYGRTSYIIPTPLSKVEITAMSPRALVEASSSSKTKPEDFTRGDYMEAQIHGGVSVKDISLVTFTDREPSQDLLKLLKDHNIQYRVLR